MATWTPHLRLTYGGQLGLTGVDTWSNTIRFQMQTLQPSQEQLQAAAAACEAPLSTWMGSSGARINNAAKLNWIKLNWVLADGKQRDQQTIIHDLVTPKSGIATTSNPPWYQTAALTFRTRIKRGRAHSGRLFPPVVAVDIPAQSPYIESAQAVGMATAGKTLLLGLRNAMAQSWQAGGGEIPVPAVFSPGDGAGRPPLWQPIIGVVVDRVPDVQHRRTKQVPRSETTVQLLDP
jgi:hypothetical protein